MVILTRHALRLCVACLLFGFAVTANQAAVMQTPAQTVRLVVDYGDGVTKTIDGLPWSKGNTVLDVMNAAQNIPHGVKYEKSGSGMTAMLKRIDDVKSEGGGTGKKNWQYWVNTSYACKSFGIYEVQPKDTVVWRFSTMAEGQCK